MNKVCLMLLVLLLFNIVSGQKIDVVIVGPQNACNTGVSNNSANNMKYFDIDGTTKLKITTLQHRSFDNSKIYNATDGTLIWEWQGESSNETWYTREHFIDVTAKRIRIEFMQGYSDPFCNGYIKVEKVKTLLPGSSTSAATNGSKVGSVEYFNPKVHKYYHPGQYASKPNVVNGCAIITKQILINGKYTSGFGMVDTEGKIILKPEYYAVNNISDDLAKVSKEINGKIKVGYVNSSGKFVIPLKYDKGTDFWEGLAAVQKGGMTGFVDKNDKVVIPFIYKWAYYDGFVKGITLVSKYENLTTFSIINKQGKVLKELTYGEVWSVYGGPDEVLKSYSQSATNSNRQTNSGLSIGSTVNGGGRVYKLFSDGSGGLVFYYSKGGSYDDLAREIEDLNRRGADVFMASDVDLQILFQQGFAGPQTGDGSWTHMWWMGNRRMVSFGKPYACKAETILNLSSDSYQRTADITRYGTIYDRYSNKCFGAIVGFLKK